MNSPKKKNRNECWYSQSRPHLEIKTMLENNMIYLDKQNKNSVPTLFFVVTAILLWCYVNFCKYTRWKYRNTKNDSEKRRAKEQQKGRLAKNEQKKKIAETLIINTRSEGPNGTYLVMLLLLLFSF